MQESQSRYSTVSIVLHWSIALFVVANIAGGILMEEMSGVFPLHKSLGVTIFALTLVRLLWRLGHPWPILPEHMPTWERILARFTHVGFYVGLLIIPLLGWAAASAHGAPATPIWGVIPWPNLPLPRSEDLGEALGGAHGLMVGFAVLLVLMHVAGALKHHFLDHDMVLHRMLPLVKPLPERHPDHDRSPAHRG